MVNTVGFNHVIFNQPARDNTTVVVPQANQSVSSGGVSLAGGGGGSLTINLGAGAGAAPAIPSFSSPFAGPMMAPAMAASVPAAAGGLGAGGPAIAIALLLMGLLLGGSKAKPKPKVKEEEPVIETPTLETRKADLVTKLKEQLKAVQDEMAKPETQADAAKMEQLKKQEAALKEALALIDKEDVTVGELKEAEALAAAIAGESAAVTPMTKLQQDVATAMKDVDDSLKMIEDMKKSGKYAAEDVAKLEQSSQKLTKIKTDMAAKQQQLSQLAASDSQGIAQLSQEISELHRASLDELGNASKVPLNVYLDQKTSYDSAYGAIGTLEWALSDKNPHPLSAEDKKAAEEKLKELTAITNLLIYDKKNDKNSEFQNMVVQAGQGGGLSKQKTVLAALGDASTKPGKLFERMNELTQETQKMFPSTEAAHGETLTHEQLAEAEKLVKETQEKLEAAKAHADNAHKAKLEDAKKALDKALAAVKKEPGNQEVIENLKKELDAAEALLGKDEKEKGGLIPGFTKGSTGWGLAIAGTALAAGGGYKYYRNIKAAPLNVATKDKMGFRGNLWNYGRKLELTAGDTVVLKDGKYMVDGTKVKVKKEQARKHLETQLARPTATAPYYEAGQWYNMDGRAMNAGEVTAHLSTNHALPTGAGVPSAASPATAPYHNGTNWCNRDGSAMNVAEEAAHLTTLGRPAPTGPYFENGNFYRDNGTQIPADQLETELAAALPYNPPAAAP